MEVEISTEAILDVVGNNLEVFIYPLSNIISECGYDDIAFAQFLKRKDFIEEVAEVLIEQEKDVMLTEFFEELKND